MELDVELISEKCPFTNRTAVLYCPQPAHSQKSGEILIPWGYPSRQQSFSMSTKKYLEIECGIKSIYRKYIVNICQQKLHFRVTMLIVP